MSFRRVLIAFDDSAIAAHAVEVGTELATALKRDSQSVLASAARRTGEPPAWQFLREGKPAEQILAAAREWDADVIVIGTHGRSGVSRLVLGSTAEFVVRHAPCRSSSSSRTPSRHACTSPKRYPL